MKGKRMQATMLVAVGLWLGFAVACAPIGHKVTGSVPKINRIDFATAVDGKDTKWENDEVKLQYQLAKEGDKLRITGMLTVKDRLLNSFPKSRFFHFYINLLDNSGHLLQQQEISPNFSYANTILGPVRIAGEVEMTQEPAAIAFSYWGQLFSQSDRNQGLQEWSVEYNPFRPEN